MPAKIEETKKKKKKKKDITTTTSDESTTSKVKNKVKKKKDSTAAASTSGKSTTSSKSSKSSKSKKTSTATSTTGKKKKKKKKSDSDSVDSIDSIDSVDHIITDSDDEITTTTVTKRKPKPATTDVTKNEDDDDTNNVREKPKNGINNTKDIINGQSKQLVPAAKGTTATRKNRVSTTTRPISYPSPPLYYKRHKLGIIFDLDGTLIAEGWDIDRYVPRPGAVDFLKWCRSRGHSLAVWTAAQPEWSDYVCKKLCLSTRGIHTCYDDCRRTFEFVWTANKLRQRSRIPNPSSLNGCAWCLHYNKVCTRCYCKPFLYNCPCRCTKDLHKVWYDPHEETKNFTREHSLIIENNPQACIHNYGNAIYVPTCKSSKELNIFPKLQTLIETLEITDNVRRVSKCDHGKGPHPCFEQRWVTELKNDVLKGISK